MKILLAAVNAKYIHSNLAVYSLKVYAEKYCNNSVEIEIAEYTINQYTEEILGDIYSRNADVLAFSCYIWNITMVKEIINNFHLISPETKIWAGGPEVSYNAEEFLKDNTAVDCVMSGEGEEIFKNLVENLSYKNYEYASIKGITFRDGFEIVKTQLQPSIDMSTIPFVYKDLSQFENRIIYYESSRGCPFSCSYCLSSIDKKLRFRDIELVKEELKFFIDNNTAQVKFVDRTFNCKKEHAMEIWHFIKENDNGITNFHFEIAADIMTDDEIELLKTMRPGLIQLEIGVQSTNEVTINLINRKTNFTKISEITGKIKNYHNIHQHLDLIAGLPYEDYESFANSFNDVYRLKPDQLQLGFLKVLYGSEMKRNVQEYGTVYCQNPPYEVLRTKWLSYEEVLKLKSIEVVVEIYYNSGQFVNSIKYLERLFQTPFEMYEQLGAFYKSQGENGEKHSRISRYNLLLEFYEKKGGFSLMPARFRQLLTLDVYLRENAKTRPAFAIDLTEHNKAIRNIYNSKLIKILLPDYKDYVSKQIAKMTHIEVVDNSIELSDINIYEPMNDTKTIQGIRFILFDYKNRNPLNHQARVIDVTELS